MALEVLDQFLNRGFCIACGSLVWCLKSQYLEILKADLPNTFKKGFNLRHKYPPTSSENPPSRDRTSDYCNILVNGQYTRIDISPLVIHKIYQTWGKILCLFLGMTVCQN